MRTQPSESDRSAPERRPESSSLVRALAAAIFGVCALLPSGACRPEGAAGAEGPQGTGGTGGTGGNGSTGAPASIGGLVVRNPVGTRPTFFDFGDLAYGQHVEHVFQIENTDSDPVTIHDILPSCGCTVARIAYTDAAGNEVPGSITPGEKVITLPPRAVAHLSVTVDTTHVETMNIDKLTQVRLRSDSKHTPYVTLEMHLVVRRTFRSVPDRIELGESPQSNGKSGRADITPELHTSHARIRAIEKIDGPFEATVDATSVSGVEVWILVATAKNDLPIGPANGRITMSTTRDDGTGEGPPFSVPVSAQITADVVLHPMLFALKGTKQDPELKAEVELVALVPGERVAVRKATAKGTGSDALKLDWTAQDPDERGRSSKWTIALRTRPEAKVLAFSGTISIELDHPRVAKIDVPYSGIAR
jgi:hypothetical protein